MIRSYFGFLVFEILVGLNAGITFSLLESRYQAALWTGGWFLILGLSLIYWTARQAAPKKNPLLWLSVIHTFLFSLPILATRALTVSNEPLQTILGFPAPAFHKAASYCFFALIVVTAYQLFSQVQRLKAKKPRT